MSISPFDSGNSKPLRASQASGSKEPMAATSITLSQALIITAGMAGLIGLFSGVIIRFSLANSPNARFLSPLQTFPELSAWPPEPSDAVEAEGDAASRDYVPGEQAEAIRTFESSEPPDYLQEQWETPTDDSSDLTDTTDPVDVTTFDTFADREMPRRRIPSGRWDALEAGPKFRSDGEGKPRLHNDSDSDGFERDYIVDVDGDLPNQTGVGNTPREIEYGEEFYSEDAYPDADRKSVV